MRVTPSSAVDTRRNYEPGSYATRINRNSFNRELATRLPSRCLRPCQAGTKHTWSFRWPTLGVDPYYGRNYGTLDRHRRLGTCPTASFDACAYGRNVWLFSHRTGYYSPGETRNTCLCTPICYRKQCSVGCIFGCYCCWNRSKDGRVALGLEAKRIPTDGIRSRPISLSDGDIYN